MYAVFPLNIIILPEESVALHLFEPRYRELFHDYKNGKEFIIAFSDKNGLSSHATTVFIDQVINEFPDGTVDIIVKGKHVVEIQQFIDKYPKKLYSAVEAKALELDGIASEKLHEHFNDYLTTIDKKVKASPPFTLFYIANRIELSQENKNELIKQSGSKGIDAFLINEIRFLLKIREQEESLNQRFHLN